MIRVRGQLFIPEFIEGNVAAFDEVESRHIIRVLRKKTGDTLFFTDGKGTLFRGEILQAGKNNVTASITEREVFPEPEKKLHVFIAPPKSFDRFAVFLEKAVELGVWSVTPVISRFSERKKINTEKMTRIALSAVKQSLRVYAPAINPMRKLEEILTADYPMYAALCDADPLSARQFAASEEAGIIIGPEGGFSPEEKDRFARHGIGAVGFGDNRLRTETAGIAAVCRFYQP